MAAGDFTLFDQYLIDIVNGVHDMDTNTIKFALITNAVTPAATDAAPHFGGTGTTNFATSEVTPGGNYTDNGETLGSANISVSTNDLSVDYANVSITQNGSNPTNARWAIVYNDTDANKRCVGFLDLGSVRDLSAGDFTYTIPANGLFRIGPGNIT